MNSEINIDRREFLHITGVAMAALVLPSKVFAATDGWIDRWWEEDGKDGAPLPGIRTPANPKRETGKYCEGRLRLKSLIHGDAYEFRFRDGDGNYDTQVLASLSWFLRCKDGTWCQMDIRTVETLNYLSALLDVPEIHITSGYRSPDYNQMLARHNENVARSSLHQFGRALDFTIPGVNIRDVCSYALYARNMLGYGGIGYYPKSSFVHLDSGPVREWAK